MTVKLVVLYTQPENPDEFERHYTEQHVPLVHKIPGLQQFDAARFVAAGDGGEVGYYRIATARRRGRLTRPSTGASAAFAVLAVVHGGEVLGFARPRNASRRPLKR